MSGNMTVVREMSGILLKIRELSGKSCLNQFIVNCIFVSIKVFSRSLFMVKYMVSGHALLLCIPTPTTDSNTRTGMI